MSNPTFNQIFDNSETVINTALDALDVGATTDARLAVHSILDRLNTNYLSIPEADRPTTYTVAKTARNTDIDTQRQTYVFTFDMALTTNGVEDEPVTA